jgi:hypothetical protein
VGQDRPGGRHPHAGVVEAPLGPLLLRERAAGAALDAVRRTPVVAEARHPGERLLQQVIDHAHDALLVGAE